LEALWSFSIGQAQQSVTPLMESTFSFGQVSLLVTYMMAGYMPLAESSLAGLITDGCMTEETGQRYFLRMQWVAP
jgi:hypothetical protein